MRGGERAQWQMNNFRSAVEDCGLRDLDYEGHAFTYNNGQEGDDNRQWEAGCEETIKKVWDEGVFDITDTISRCAIELGKWKGSNIGQILKDLRKKRGILKRLNEGEQSRSVLRERKAVISEIAGLLRKDESYWRQRSRALWLKDGDKNTKFFHRKAQQQPANFENILEGVSGRVTHEMNDFLRAPYKGDEIVEALNQMHPLKAPGPDGMNALFYQTYWHIVGPSVVRMTLNVLNGAPFPAGLNTTQIVLIPKKKAPDKFVDFRPISLCNVLYKLISKVLANRLKKFLGEIVSENQSAFTPGRLITDNVLIAFEMFHYMKNSRGTGDIWR
ncbi:uncharacterized protein LOC141632430 [Silene latifolia]|uniref:uncharacterized protein LOC141632430 n=1 Tax=Silene latifolia TaxID=37657 RepID=UPI003D77AA2E